MPNLRWNTTVARSAVGGVMIALLGVSSAVSLHAANDDSTQRPSIIFILADDLGFNQVGAYGDKPIQTPDLDQLASSAIRFTQA